MLKNVTLEMSLKPFMQTDDAYIRQVCKRIFTDWAPLAEHAEQVSVMFWAADGSEILDYRGNLEDTFEWCYLVGGANPREVWDKESDPDRLGLHARNYLYAEHPPRMTYGILKTIVQCIKEEGVKLFPDKKIRVGETFDPGPEFAKSSFKYERHNEICTSLEMGASSFVCSYTTLHADDVPYAGFPDGIPEGLPFGTFLGRQCQHFLSDLGFDYIWLSNGLGFGRDTWSATGALFDGSTFDIGNLDDVKQCVLDFWELFTAECTYPIETRGTNLSMGIDFATEGVPLKTIYEKVDILPPPNSPWAAINFDFGLELMGHLSRIAAVPNRDFMFRYYVHDPWWMNSPWYDRYEGQPHDIYLPMSLARIEKGGEVQAANYLNLLSIDNSWGEMPQSCVIEPLPHLIKAVKEAPDDIPPVVWIYPFGQYSDARTDEELNCMYSEDWFIRGAINNGFPLSAVISDENFIETDWNLFEDSVLVTVVPKAGSQFEKSLTEYATSGGKLLVYGGVDHASKEFLDLIGIERAEQARLGELKLTVKGEEKKPLKVGELFCAGGVNTFGKDCYVLAEAEGMVVASKKGSVAWTRGICSCETVGRRLLIPQDPNRYFIGETLMNILLSEFEIGIKYEKEPEDNPPVMTISRYKNGFFYAVYAPVTTVKTILSMPQGAPVLMGYDTIVDGNQSSYYFPRAERKECRLFVTQQKGRVRAREVAPVSMQYRRCIEISNLKDAMVRYYPEYPGEEICATLNWAGDGCFHKDSVTWYYDEKEKSFLFEHITGNLRIYEPMRRPIFD